MGMRFQSYSQRIWKWIMVDKVPSIGIWGIGGSGKTALATHIHNKILEEQASRDIKVIWVTVSQNSILQLQRVIARSIELDISDEFELKNIAGKLLQAFKKMKRCVVILDDVWDHFFLKEVGFPLSDNRITLILTTRIWEACQGMGCKKNTIKVEPLDRDDSWALFENIAGFYGGLSLKVEKIARNMANECDGFPLAIVRIATSMQGEEHAKEWSHMLEGLENLGNGQYEMDKWVLPVLRSSYDFLNKKLQRFFLYYVFSTANKTCFSDGVDGLIRRFVFESIDVTKTLMVQYNEGYIMWDKLKNHTLLEKRTWCINKFLRVMAIGILEDFGKIMANAYKELTEIPGDDFWEEDLQKVVLTGNYIQTIPEGTCPRCFQLSTLFLDCNAKLDYISDDFFNNMPALKTLDLSKTAIKRLPESLSNLKCLVALLASGCKKLSYIPSVRKLTRLISLDLSDTAIKEAPHGLDSLVNLRWLNLKWLIPLYGNMPKMPPSYISTLINLEILVLIGPLAEPGIQGLKRLEVIVAYFGDISVFNASVSFLEKNQVYRSFDLTLKDKDGYDRYYCSYDVKNDHDILINRGDLVKKRITLDGANLENRKVLIPRDTEELRIYSCRQGRGNRYMCDMLSYAHNSYRPNSNTRQIEKLDVICCEDVEYLCCLSKGCLFCDYSSQIAVFSINEHIELLKPDLSILLFSFSELTELSIKSCDSMESVMTPQLLALLPNLHSIYVGECDRMKQIVAGEHSYPPSDELMAVLHNGLSHPICTLPKLTSLTLELMPQLNSVYSGILCCPSLQEFFAFSCGLLNPPVIEISNGRAIQIENTPDGCRWQCKIWD